MRRGPAPRRVFLGWSGPFLPAAADWLVAQHGADLGALLVALPGARAGRRMGELLARRQPSTWRPPRIVTAGRLPDELLTLELPIASRLVRTLLWAEALADLPEAPRRHLLAAPPARDDRRAWFDLAAEVRALFGELAAEGRSFADVLRVALPAESEGERARWEALARVQSSVERALAEARLADPHLARLRAVEAGAIATGVHVVLVGVADPNGLQRRVIEMLGDAATLLIGAPAELADGFDELGAVRAAFWSERETSLAPGRWTVAGDPGQQAEAAAGAIVRLGGEHCAAELSIGVADVEVVPFLERRLAAHGLVGRDAAGAAVADSRPARLLAAVAAYVRRPRYRELAALVRHPDLARALDLEDDARDAAADLDDYFLEHLPDRIDGHWRGGTSERDDARAERLGRRYAGLRAALGELLGGRPRPLARWAEVVRNFLESVLGTRAFDPDAFEPDRRIVAALRAIAATLAEVAELPARARPTVDAAEALHILLRELSAARIPPAPPRADEAAIELLGWLELPLDDAPALVVTGFNEGRVPERLPHPSWLPESARVKLGLESGERRLARDLYFLEWLLASKRSLHLVSGRRSLDGDPLLPSRLALRVGPDRIVEHVRHALGEPARTPLHESQGGGGYRPYVDPRARIPEVVSVTAFRDYLASPYLFYLRHVERLDTLDDRTEELDGRTFGSLAHAVLEDFGRSPSRASNDERAIARFLKERLDELAAARFGDGAQPAVAVQLAQLGYRLALFAREQARHVAQGWSILHVEWTPPEAASFLDVDGEPIRLRGKVDRIDRHSDGRIAILDYKTGEKSDQPMNAHRWRGNWRDLQLPLYAWLARDVVGDAPLEAGYASLGGDKVGIELVAWPEEDLESALRKAREVVRALRGRSWSDLGRAKAFDPITRAVLGEGLFGGTLRGEGDEAE